MSLISELAEVTLKDELSTVMKKVKYGDEAQPKTEACDKFVTDGKHWFFNRKNGGLGKAT